ncbi:MAG: aspartate-semialdehyde dehydrogenase [Elusimicrobiota bacterium]
MKSAVRKKGLRVAIVGATGMVGYVLLERLERRRFPVGTLLPFSSGRSRGAAVRFRGRRVAAPGVDVKALRSADIVFLVSSDEVSKRYGKALAREGVWVIDDSSAFRMDPEVPLVIPEVNAGALSRDKRLVAGPNCTTSGLAVAGYPLHLRARARRVRMASYQAVSGAGREPLLEYYAQVRRGARSMTGKDILPRLPAAKARAFPKPIAFSLFPHVGSFDERGDSGEENKVRNELRKIWSAPKLEVSSTTVRVPVIRGHSLAVWIETDKPLSPRRAEALLARAPGVTLWKRGDYPTVYETGGTDPVHVGRIRRSRATPRELAMWVVSDNLLKGAALNSIQVAERLLAKRWLRPRSL